MRELKWWTNQKEDYLQYIDDTGERFLPILGAREVLIAAAEWLILDLIPPADAKCMDVLLEGFETIMEMEEKRGGELDDNAIRQRVKHIIGHDMLGLLCKGKENVVLSPLKSSDRRLMATA